MIQWQQLDQKFVALSLREKWLITGCGFVAIFFVGIFTFIQPLMADADSAHLSTLDVKNQVITANNQVIVLNNKLKADPDAKINANIAKLQHQETQLKLELDKKIDSLITPQQMPALLEHVLQQSASLHLVSMESLSPIQLTAGKDVGYYIHPVRLTFTGRYFDVIGYLAQLEALPVKYYWRFLDYRVEKYPEATISLEVYTLGESKDFIGG